MKDMPQKAWYKGWFNSHYYHLLYQHRDDEEAFRFIRSLIDYLQPPAGSFMVDIACGKGRHALQIHNLGNDVVGVDLSPQSIDAANKKAEKGLSFQTGDMRNLPFNNEFDVVVNLFTSFGYFKEEEDDKRKEEEDAKKFEERELLARNEAADNRRRQALAEIDAEKLQLRNQVNFLQLQALQIQAPLRRKLHLSQ